MKLTICLLAILASGINITAQVIRHTGDQTLVQGGVAGGVLVHEQQGVGPQIEWIAEETTFSGKVVKGAPYSGEAITEITRVLQDGNRINRKTTAVLYRDSQGRTRREMRLGAIGPWPVAGESRESIFINDPVANVNYMLEPDSRTAQKLPASRWELGPVEGRGESKMVTVVARAGVPGGAGGGAPGHVVVDRKVFTQRVPEPKTESLGKRFIEGVQAEGSRSTMTIPAGQIGNERPIEIVSERWYSPELQTVVSSKRIDPLSGDTVFRLTNINRSEPAPALFQVPPGYTVKEATPHTSGVVIEKKSHQSK